MDESQELREFQEWQATRQTIQQDKPSWMYITIIIIIAAVYQSMGYWYPHAVSDPQYGMTSVAWIGMFAVWVVYLLGTYLCDDGRHDIKLLVACILNTLQCVAFLFGYTHSLVADFFNFVIWAALKLSGH
jgi:hypothetical protein